jgi:hypothetical protein
MRHHDQQDLGLLTGGARTSRCPGSIGSRASSSRNVAQVQPQEGLPHALGDDLDDDEQVRGMWSCRWALSRTR